MCWEIASLYVILLEAVSGLNESLHHDLPLLNKQGPSLKILYHCTAHSKVACRKSFENRSSRWELTTEKRCRRKDRRTPCLALRYNHLYLGSILLTPEGLVTWSVVGPRKRYIVSLQSDTDWQLRLNCWIKLQAICVQCQNQKTDSHWIYSTCQIDGIDITYRKM